MAISETVGLKWNAGGAYIKAIIDGVTFGYSNASSMVVVFARHKTKFCYWAKSRLASLSPTVISTFSTTDSPKSTLLPPFLSLLPQQDQLPTYSCRKSPPSSTPNRNNEANSRTDPNLPLLPQPPQRARTGSQRCVQAEKSRYCTLRRAKLIS